MSILCVTDLNHGFGDRTILKNVSYKDMKKFVLDNMESIYNVKNVLMDEVNDIGNKCMSVFEIYEIIKHVK